MIKEIVCSVVCLLALLKTAEAVKPLGDRPNVIFVFTDDERYNSLGVTGDPVTQTPNIDRLAKEGVLFNQAFITSPICGPSRANIFTGQWERKNHIGFNYISHNDISLQTFNNSWLMQLKQAGYSTAFIGKHHVKIVDKGNTPLKKNIDFCYYGEGHLGFYPADHHKVFSNLKHKTQVEGLFEATEAYLKPGHDFDYFYDNADASFKNCLRRRDPNKPFCAWINFNLPHQASIGGMGSRPDDPKFYSTLYADKESEIPIPEGYPFEVSMPADVFSSADLMSYYRYTREGLPDMKMKMDRAVYAIDQFVGNLRQLLMDIGEADNTIIVFCSDNGLFLGEHGLGGKTILYEESVHVPMIIYSPLLPNRYRGAQKSQLVVGQDIPATILDLCGVKVPETYQGKSMRPLMVGKDVGWRKDVFLENLFTDQGYPREEAVRGQEWKYIRYFSKADDRSKYLPQGIAGEQPIYEELFNLKDDPNETQNLANKPEFAKILNSYRTRCQELQTDLGK